MFTLYSMYMTCGIRFWVGCVVECDGYAMATFGSLNMLPDVYFNQKFCDIYKLMWCCCQLFLLACCRIVLPLGQSYVLAGYFSVGKKILRALVENALFYITLFIIFLVLFIYLVVVEKILVL